MWLAAQTFLRGISPKAWAVMAMAAGALLLAVWLFQAGRGAERRDHGERVAGAVTRAAGGRETAATERALDTGNVAGKLKEWNDAAERIPDAPPDQRELARRCRQLRDAGQHLAACRGPAGTAQAGAAR